MYKVVVVHLFTGRLGTTVKLIQIKKREEKKC